MGKISFLLLFLIAPQFASAQGGGHVGGAQQEAPQFRLRVIKGDKAEKIYNVILKSGARRETDIGFRCSQPVKYIETWADDNNQYKCFDRGPDFSGGSRYKCYVPHENYSDFYLNFGLLFTDLQNKVFKILHNSCGGDGIFPETHQTNEEEDQADW